MTTGIGAKVRAAAAEVVHAVVDGRQSLDAVIDDKEAAIPERDRPLLRMLAYGALRHHWQLQEWIDGLLAKPLRKRDRVVNALLAVGLFQLVHLRIPDHAVVSETVAAVRRLKRPNLAGMVNGCLRRFVRDGLATVEPKTDAARWNHPDWLITMFRNDWPDDWQSIVSANQERAPMWLRANATNGTAAEYQQRLQAAGMAADLLDGVPQALRLHEPQPVDRLPGFQDGDASVQDAAAQLAAVWLSPGGQERVLDACAAPGGKSGHLLETGGPGVSLVCVDSDATRVRRIEENLVRIGRDATIIAADASKPKDWWDGQPFDAILLDAPCSATGVIRRHPDIRLLRRESDIANLARLQRRLLDALWPMLAPGGRLIYVTCSVLAMENDVVTGQFLNDRDDAVEDDVLPINNIRDLMRRKVCGYQILPGTAGMDGFYYAAFKKKVS